MVDTLANLEAVYNKWSERNPWSSGQKSSSRANTQTKPKANLPDYETVVEKGRQWYRSNYRDMAPPPIRRTTDRRRNRNRDRNATSTPFTEIYSSGWNLASFKTMPTIMPVDESSRRPYMGRCCACMPASKIEHHEDGVEQKPLHNLLRVTTAHRKNGWWTRTFSHVSYCLQRDVSHLYPDVSMAVLVSPRLLETIQKAALQELGVDPDGTVVPKKLNKAVIEHRRRAKAMVKKMRATISNVLIRLTGWFLHKLLSRLFSSIVVHSGQMNVLANVCKHDLPVIFLPTHQSHMDYILLTFLLFNYDLRAPHVAAGDNLRIPFFSSLMRGLGGYFIRRKLDGRHGNKDIIYRSVLHTYMQELLRKGQYFEFFIEGGRTRTGKALYPKGGLLSVIVDSYLDGSISDAYLVPVSISYEKLLDGDFSKELMGQPKQPETFWRACTAIWRVLWGHFGNVRMDTGQPFSLSEYLAVCQSQIMTDSPVSASPMSRSFNSSQSLLSDFGSDDHRLTVQTLAQHVVHSCVGLRAIMSTHIVAFLLLTKHRTGVSLSTLARDADWLKEELQIRGKDVGFTGVTSEVVLYACHLLGKDLVRLQAKDPDNTKNRIEGDQNNNPSVLFVEPLMSLPTIFQLSYYANAVIPVFALESILAVCILAELDGQSWSEDETPTLKRSDLVAAATHLVHLLHVDFILKPPCESWDIVINRAIDNILVWEVITIDEAASNTDNEWAERFSRTLDMDDEDDEAVRFPEIIYNIDVTTHGFKHLRFLHGVLAPLLETYYTTIVMATSAGQTPCSEKKLVADVHQRLLERVNTGVSTSAESASLAAVKTAVQGLRQLHLLEVKEVKDGVSQLLVSEENKDHLQNLLDLLVNYNPDPLNSCK